MIKNKLFEETIRARVEIVIDGDTTKYYLAEIDNKYYIDYDEHGVISEGEELTELEEWEVGKLIKKVLHKGTTTACSELDKLYNIERKGCVVCNGNTYLYIFEDNKNNSKSVIDFINGVIEVYNKRLTEINRSKYDK